MTIAQQIKHALVHADISQAELARKFGITPQAFAQRMTAEKFSTADLEKIARILGAEYKHYFEFPDGSTF